MLRAAAGLILTMIVSCVGAHADGRRVALVIGNSTYKYAGKLPNPGNDAADVAESLKRLNFQVTLEKDLEWDQLARSVDTFLGQARGADVAVFFYAGHGLQHNEGAYILPVDARLENEFSLKRETFSAQEIVSQLGMSTNTSIVLLDACRNNPLAEKLRNSMMSGSRAVNVGRGLGRIEVGGNSLVVYSAAPGQEARDGAGRNSPFTEALLKHMETPGLEVEQMLKRVTAEVTQATGGRQQPERLSQLKTEVMFNPNVIAAPVATPAVVTGPGPAAPATATPTNYGPQPGEVEKLRLEQEKRERELRERELVTRERELEELKRRDDELRKREEELSKRLKALQTQGDQVQKQNQQAEKQREQAEKQREQAERDRELAEKQHQQLEANRKKVQKEQEELQKREQRLAKEAEELARTKAELEKTQKERQRNSAQRERNERSQPRDAASLGPDATDYSVPGNRRQPYGEAEPDRPKAAASKPVKQAKPRESGAREPSYRDMEPAPRPVHRPTYDPPAQSSGSRTTAPPAP